MKCNARDKIVKRESVEQAVYYMLLAFIQTLGDKYGWNGLRIVDAMKHVKNHADAIAGDYTTIRQAADAVYEEYGIKFDDDGGIYAAMDVPVDYGLDEWKPLAERKPETVGSYMVTTSKGAVCMAHWNGTGFGTVGKNALAWKELPEPWEFWDEGVGSQ